MGQIHQAACGHAEYAALAPLDPTIGVQKFANDRSLSAKQIATIVQWVDVGALPGDKKVLPAPKVWPDVSAWQYARVIGQEPDFVITSADWTVPAAGQDQWWKPVSDVPVTEPRWSSRRRSFGPLQQPAEGSRTTLWRNWSRLSRLPPMNIGSAGPAPLTEWAIGKTWDAYRPGTGKLIVPGAEASLGHSLPLGG